MNIELRWLDKETIYGGKDRERVLQYRTGKRLPAGVESAHYISDGIHGSKLVRRTTGPDIDWSDWRDVPTEAE